MPGKWLVVTGGARGLGAAIARAGTRDGFSVALWDADLEAARETAGEIVGDTVAVGVDVTDEAGVAAAFEAMPEPPQALVNNAGIVRFGPLLDLPMADWEAALRVNLTGAFLVGRAFARLAGDRPRCVVNVASINGVATAPFAGAYSASKAGIVMLTQQMALEWAQRNVRVNCVAPGLIDAGMSEPIYADPDVRRLRSGTVPLRRLGTAEDVAGAVSFLLSDAAAYVTGQTIVVDGGITISALASLPRPRTVDSVGH